MSWFDHSQLVKGKDPPLIQCPWFFTKCIFICSFRIPFSCSGKTIIFSIAPNICHSLSGSYRGCIQVGERYLLFKCICINLNYLWTCVISFQECVNKFNKYLLTLPFFRVTTNKHPYSAEPNQQYCILKWIWYCMLGKLNQRKISEKEFNLSELTWITQPPFNSKINRHRSDCFTVRMIYNNQVYV